MPFAHSGGARIYWHSHGLADAPPVVLMHTIGTDMGIYARAMPYLEQHFRLLNMDIRGHGASDAPDAEYSLSLLGRDVCAVMDAAGAERAIVCGTSIGAMIAMQMALDSPARIRGLVLANTSAAMDPALWPERIRMVRRDGIAHMAEGWVSRHFSPQFMAESKAITDSVFLNMEAMNPLGYLGCAAAIRDMDLLNDLHRIEVPSLLIAGELDGPTPYAGHGDRIVAAIPGASVEFLPAGHLSCVEQPELFAKAVIAFAARCAP